MNNKIKNAIFILTHWETWDWRIKYIPLIPSWIYYCIKSRSFWFFTPSNPTLFFGGFDGVSKKDMYKHLPSNLYPKSIYVSPEFTFEGLSKIFTDHNFSFPVAVKPEIGRMGLMFRKIETVDDLKLYHERMPVNYILQDFINYPIEVSVFYYRFPDDQHGTITGFLEKKSLQVIGDGRSTLLQLINDSPRARQRLEEMKLKHADKLNNIIPQGEIFCLSYALNLSRGGRLINLEHQKDQRLLKVFDELSHYSKYFYYGRYDIKCASIEDLKRGENYSILEYNGSGGEPHHVYGNGNTLIKACKILAQHWDVMYKISKCNNDKGVHYCKTHQGWEYFKNSNKHVRMLQRLDSEFPVS